MRWRLLGARTERGAAVLEFALVAPLLIMFLLGVVTAGIAYNTRLQMTHAAREGARFGATIPQDQSFATGTWASNVRTLVVARSAGELEDADVCVALVRGAAPVPASAQHTTDPNGDACYDDSAAGETGLRVQVVGEGTATIETGFWSTEVTLRAQATAKHETAAA